MRSTVPLSTRHCARDLQCSLSSRLFCHSTNDERDRAELARQWVDAADSPSHPWAHSTIGLDAAWANAFEAGPPANRDSGGAYGRRVGPGGTATIRAMASAV